MECIKINYAVIMYIAVVLNVIFSSNAFAVTPALKCAQVPEFQFELNKVDETYRAKSKEFFIYKSSSTGWVMENYLFIGKIDGKYVISFFGSNIPMKNVDITESEFEKLFNTAKNLFNGKELSTSSTEHYHCTQLIIKSSTTNNNVVLSGFPSDARLRFFDKLTLKMLD
jgi:hypothetical protein